MKNIFTSTSLRGTKQSHIDPATIICCKKNKKTKAAGPAAILCPRKPKLKIDPMLTYLFAGLLGILFQVLVKMNSLKNEFETANEIFSAKKFFQRDYLSIALSLVAVIIAATVLNEVLKYKPEVANWVKCFFVMVGALGSWALQLFFGKSKKYIRAIIDEKTNIADGKK